MAIAESRLDIMHVFLKDHHLQGWFSWRPEELLLQLGHVPYWGLSFLLLLHDGESILFTPEIEPQDALPKDVTVVTYPWGSLRCLTPFDVLLTRVQSELDKRHLEKDSIGVLRNSNRSSLPIMAAEQPQLPAGVLQELTQGMVGTPQIEAAFLALYLHKTPAEIEHIRLANKVARIGLDAWQASLVTGATEAGTAAVAEAAIQSTTGKEGIQTARAWAMVQSGCNTAQAGRFNRSSGRQIKSGDLALIELATCVNGYWSDLTRTHPVGLVSAEDADVLHAVHISQQAAIRAIRPGISASDIDATARESLHQAGFADFFTHATGHHTGFRYHDSGFAIAPGGRGTLQPGMVITIEPGVYLPERGIGARIEDNIVVTSSGADILSRERNTRLD